MKHDVVPGDITRRGVMSVLSGMGIYTAVYFHGIHEHIDLHMDEHGIYGITKKGPRRIVLPLIVWWKDDQELRF